MRRTVRGVVVQEEGVAVEGTRTLRVRASVCACASLTRRLRSAAKGGGGGGRGVGGETGGNGGQAGSSTARVRVGPSKAKLRHAGPSSNLCFSHSASPSLLSLLRAISVSLLRARSPSLFLSLSLSLSLSRSLTNSGWLCLLRGVLSPSVCLPACFCLSVGRIPLSPRVPQLWLSCAVSLPLTRLGNVSLARGINTPVGRLRAAKRPKPRSRKRRRLYRVTPRAAFVALYAASESIVRKLFQPIGPPRLSRPRRHHPTLTFTRSIYLFVLFSLSRSLFLSLSLSRLFCSFILSSQLSVSPPQRESNDDGRVERPASKFRNGNSVHLVTGSVRFANFLVIGTYRLLARFTPSPVCQLGFSRTRGLLAATDLRAGRLRACCFIANDLNWPCRQKTRHFITPPIDASLLRPIRVTYTCTPRRNRWNEPRAAFPRRSHGRAIKVRQQKRKR